jgi:hypothetical protein
MNGFFFPVGARDGQGETADLSVNIDRREGLADSGGNERAPAGIGGIA